MSVRRVLLLVAAVASAGLTALVANQWINSERAAMRASGPKPVAESEGMEILIAKQTLAAGSFIRPERVTWQAWPEKGLSEEYAVKGKASLKDFEGAVVRTAIPAGQPITLSAVVRPGDRGFLAAVLPSGMRAVSVPINATTGISGFVFPGDWVDVIVTMKVRVKNDDGDNETRHFSQTLLQDIRVLATDQRIEHEDGKAKLAKTATLEVTPKQAEKIALSLELGELSLSLNSLAREEKLASNVARVIGVDAKQTLRRRPITLDSEVNYGILGPRRKKVVNVLRGGKDAEKAAY